MVCTDLMAMKHLKILQDTASQEANIPIHHRVQRVKYVFCGINMFYENIMDVLWINIKG